MICIAILGVSDANCADAMCTVQHGLDGEEQRDFIFAPGHCKS